MADTRQDGPLTTVIILATVTVILALVARCYDQELTIHALRQQLSQQQTYEAHDLPGARAEGCEGRK